MDAWGGNGVESLNTGEVSPPNSSAEHDSGLGRGSE